MPFVPSTYVSGSTLSSWTPLRSPTRPELTTWYHASSGTMIDYNSTRDSASTVSPGTTRRDAVTAAFGDTIRAADSRATSRPTTPSATSARTGATATPTSSPSSGSSGGSGSPRNFGARYSYYPEDLATTKQDRIKFEMLTAANRGGAVSRASSSGLIGFGRLPRGESLGTVFMGVRGNNSDSNSVD